MKLLSHINNDGDILEAWLKYYLERGISSFHLIVHGSQEENSRLFQLKDSYPIVIEDSYAGEFRIEEKERRINDSLTKMRGEWVLLVDSDEFVEFPYSSLMTTIRILNFMGANALWAPMLQRITMDGSIDTSENIIEPFREFPLCSIDLYKEMGVEASISKYPLFLCSDKTIVSGGNHHLPNGSHTIVSDARGVTHHFKWRKTILRRLASRIKSSHIWRHESETYKSYLEKHQYRIPIDNTFIYSRRELFKKGLLKKATLMRVVKECIKKNSMINSVVCKILSREAKRTR